MDGCLVEKLCDEDDLALLMQCPFLVSSFFEDETCSHRDESLDEHMSISPCHPDKKPPVPGGSGNIAKSLYPFLVMPENKPATNFRLFQSHRSTDKRPISTNENIENNVNDGRKKLYKYLCPSAHISDRNIDAPSVAARRKRTIQSACEELKSLLGLPAHISKLDALNHVIEMISSHKRKYMRK